MNERRVCIVTGGSRGIGRAVAKGLAAGGAHVLLVARDRQRLEDARATIAEETGGSVEAYPADLSLIAEIKSLASRIKSAHPRIGR